MIDWADLHGDAFTGRHALVTGGAGFIGSHLTEALLRLGATVTVIDDLSGGDAANINVGREAVGFQSHGPHHRRLRFIEASILDEAALHDAITGTDLVFHQAALGSVPRSVEQPERYHAANTTGTFAVLQAARTAGVKRVMFAASSSAYGDSETLPKVESMPALPRSPYAATKVAGEAMLRAWSASYGLDTVSLRYFNIFGPRQNANSAYAAVIAAFAKALLAGERPVIFGDGEQSRDFTPVANAVHANLLAARCTTPLEGSVINVALGRRVTVNQLATRMADLLNRSDLTPEHRDDRAGDVRHSLADLSRAKGLLGYEPVMDFATGLEPTVAWYREVMGGSA